MIFRVTPRGTKSLDAGLVAGTSSLEDLQAGRCSGTFTLLAFQCTLLGLEHSAFPTAHRMRGKVVRLTEEVDIYRVRVRPGDRPRALWLV